MKFAMVDFTPYSFQDEMMLNRRERIVLRHLNVRLSTE
jgi:hypothetical protein